MNSKPQGQEAFHLETTEETAEETSVGSTEDTTEDTGETETGEDTVD